MTSTSSDFQVRSDVEQSAKPLEDIEYFANLNTPGLDYRGYDTTNSKTLISGGSPTYGGSAYWDYPHEYFNRTVRGRKVSRCLAVGLIILVIVCMAAIAAGTIIGLRSKGGKEANKTIPRTVMLLDNEVNGNNTAYIIAKNLIYEEDYQDKNSELFKQTAFMFRDQLNEVFLAEDSPTRKSHADVRVDSIVKDKDGTGVNFTIFTKGEQAKRSKRDVGSSEKSKGSVFNEQLRQVYKDTLVKFLKKNDGKIGTFLFDPSSLHFDGLDANLGPNPLTKEDQKNVDGVYSNEVEKVNFLMYLLTQSFS